MIFVCFMQHHLLLAADPHVEILTSTPNKGEGPNCEKVRECLSGIDQGAIHILCTQPGGEGGFPNCVQMRAGGRGGSWP